MTTPKKKGRPRKYQFYDMEVGATFEAGPKTVATGQIASTANITLAPKRFKSKTIGGVVVVTRVE